MFRIKTLLTSAIIVVLAVGAPVVWASNKKITFEDVMAFNIRKKSLDSFTEKLLKYENLLRQGGRSG